MSERLIYLRECATAGILPAGDLRDVVRELLAHIGDLERSAGRPTVSEHLTKAKAALDAARDTTTQTEMNRLLDIASIQARIATAEALTRIADKLESEKS